MKSKLFKNSERRITKAFTKKKTLWILQAGQKFFFYEIILILKSCSHAISLLFLN